MVIPIRIQYKIIVFPLQSDIIPYLYQKITMCYNKEAARSQRAEKWHVTTFWQIGSESHKSVGDKGEKRGQSNTYMLLSKFPSNLPMSQPFLAFLNLTWPLSNSSKCPEC